VTKLCTLLALLLIGSAAGAEPAGRVSDASGALLARTAAGSIKVLAVGSPVETGETLFTRADTYAKINFSDQSTVSLGPDTELVVAKYAFHEAGEESASLGLIRGRVRISSGILGARHANNFTLAAGDTTIDIRRSTFIAEFVPARATAFMGGHTRGLYRSVSLRLAQNAGGGSVNGGRSPGLYVQVLDGMINVTNGGGAQNFSAGQFGFTPNFNQPPIILPKNPGMQFTPPPSFSNSTGGTQNGNSGGKPGEVDCIVR
jgi:hypothetical protein